MSAGQNVDGFTRMMATGHHGGAVSIAAKDAISIVQGLKPITGTCACGGAVSASVRLDTGLPCKCASCRASYSVVFAASDLSQLKAVHDDVTDCVLENCNVRVVGRLTPP